MGYRCTDCLGEVSASDNICPHCGADVRDIEENEELPEKRYSALRTISVLYRVAAWGILVLTAIIAVIFLSQLIQHQDVSSYIFFSIIGGSLLFITLLAIFEGIKVIIDIEDNTRTILNILKNKDS